MGELSRVLVTGAHPLARGLADGLRQRGHGVAVVGTDVPCSFSTEDEVAGAIGTATERLGRIDQVVHAWVAGELLIRQSLVDVDPGLWAQAGERSLDGAWWVSRAIGPRVTRSVVFVVPTVGLVGAAGYAMLSAVSEGIRVLGKACARQWAVRGVTVNTVVTAAQHWVDAESATAISRTLSITPPAFGHHGDATADLAPLVAALGHHDLHHLTAATLVADGGEWTGL
jgi:NAD(P)-dependent dehydrogenase (short-subunit alcohol dehydrogenase family)